MLKNIVFMGVLPPSLSLNCKSRSIAAILFGFVLYATKTLSLLITWALWCLYLQLTRSINMRNQYKSSINIMVHTTWRPSNLGRFQGPFRVQFPIFRAQNSLCGEYSNHILIPSKLWNQQYKSASALETPQPIFHE